jgi:hypothetical protein
VADESSDGPKVRIVGIYRIAEYPEVHLVEVHVDAPPSSVDVGAFGQDDTALSPRGWQVAYDERYLDAPGDAFISARWAVGWKPLHDGVAEPSVSRLIFFLHHLSLDRPLRTPFGPIDPPAPSELPQRLARIVAYEPPD